MSKPKNYLYQSLALVSIVVIALLSLTFIPESITEKLGLRKIDILSDIRVQSDTLLIDTVSLPTVEVPVFVDTCPFGLVCLEDFSVNQNGMDTFYEALNCIEQLDRPVRIAFYGDSYIEGDIFCSDLRSSLQDRLGGSGVGLVGAASATAGFRQTVKHTFSGWKSYSLVDVSKPDYSKMGIAGNYFIPNGNAWIRYSGIANPLLDTVQRVRILYRLPAGKTELSYKLNNKTSKKVPLQSGEGVQCVNITDSLGIGSIQLNFRAINGLNVFGASLEDSTGILVDNFSLRGMPGTSLKAIPAITLQEFDKHLHYDLIILEYGLNAMGSKVTNYKRYQEDMIKTVEHLKSAFPQTSILLLSVGDRSMKKEGEYVTMPGVTAMVAYQQAICAQTGLVFWNMFEAMGGAGSMPKMVKAKPPQANKDYTHLTFAGGKYLADRLLDALWHGKEQYAKKNQYAN